MRFIVGLNKKEKTKSQLTTRDWYGLLIRFLHGPQAINLYGQYLVVELQRERERERERETRDDKISSG